MHNIGETQLCPLGNDSLVDNTVDIREAVVTAEHFANCVRAANISPQSGHR
jgi:hypothetical protein